jgi:hypothetical protein
MEVLTKPKKLVTLILSATAIGAVCTAVMLAPRPAQATPAYASQTGQACGACHKNPAGGGPLTSRGAKFQANGHK